ncbi:hypothetical protein Tsubulata_044710 [Turnera subulata]|uniref:glycerol-3-phosphate dehydrogenase n=1 Tax=Turnera subulata TaxID=218843 RepID=A0A9Q0G6G3_9ROSI|nr:hypothetical protein Tsubulata_044710 [Turnera subulata]
MLARNGKDKMLVWYNLRGTVVYYDGQMNDSRLNVGLACTAALAGAAVLNHAEARKFETYAKVVVNAAGPFCDAVRKMVDKDAKPMICPSSGVHIVLPSYYFPERMGLIVPKTKDGHVVFMLPWLGRTVAGTTDSNTVITQLPEPHKDEIQFILDAISDYLTLKVRSTDVLSAWSGICPLATVPSAKNTESTSRDHKNTESISRDHVVCEGYHGLLTKTGGKWTTYRSSDKLHPVGLTFREWPWLGRTVAGTADSNTVITQLAEPHEDEIIFQLRLSIELPKADKVLVVERVIESLGLRTVRFPWLEEKRSEEFLVAKESGKCWTGNGHGTFSTDVRRTQSYHGPVKRVEEYFAGLGINVPERVNPPDHFIDIVEGIVTPSASSGVNHEELPVRWMLKNGVDHHHFRICKQRLIDYLILLLVGACLRSIEKVGDGNFGVSAYAIIAVSLLCKIAALRSFSLDKLQYWREASSGTPRSSVTDNYIVLLCLVYYCVTGISYAVVVSFEPGPARLWAFLLPVVLTLFATQRKGNEFWNKIAKLCYPRWGLEAFVIPRAERYYGVWLITRCGSLLKSGYDLHLWGLCIFILILIGVLSRVEAFFDMAIFQKKWARNLILYSFHCTRWN